MKVNWHFSAAWLLLLAFCVCQVLFLTALGIEEEEKCIANELPFNFNLKATQG